MALREQSDGGLPVVLANPQDAAATGDHCDAGRLIANDAGPRMPMMAAEPIAARRLRPRLSPSACLPMGHAVYSNRDVLISYIILIALALL